MIKYNTDNQEWEKYKYEKLSPRKNTLLERKYSLKPKRLQCL